MYFFSPSANAFYPARMKEDYILAGSFPDDVVAVEEALWFEFAGDIPPAGKVRIAGADGLPAWGDAPEPDIDPVAGFDEQKQILLADAENVIAPLARAVKYGIATGEEKARLEAWEKYSVLLNRVGPEYADWPERPE
ncbi:tail fiber assembly protein [Lelliottia nimipressuralis]|uniref:Tail fiber assembly protein n=1 Tax=Lelliottia nimipressuralis TaxID=69220 RepID=A0ABY3P673_9ENTR|nr:tail fiber assembly protein [Lelliottia nimipressuralis]RXJ21509.1 tail fiber assembly protein [Lelliottia nimipressuralis]TYT34939.1 tail fiber assembly protein [Lelliottia nimipressuralis]